MDLDTSFHLILIKIYEVDGIISTLQVRKAGVAELRNLPGATALRWRNQDLNWALTHSKADSGAGGQPWSRLQASPQPTPRRVFHPWWRSFIIGKRQQQK